MRQSDSGNRPLPVTASQPRAGGVVCSPYERLQRSSPFPATGERPRAKTRVDHRNTEEAALVRRVQAQDEMAFREIVERYQAKVFPSSTAFSATTTTPKTLRSRFSQRSISRSRTSISAVRCSPGSTRSRSTNATTICARSGSASWFTRATSPKKMPCGWRIATRLRIKVRRSTSGWRSGIS